MINAILRATAVTVLLSATLFGTACVQLAQLGDSVSSGAGAQADSQTLTPLSTEVFVDIPASAEVLGALQVIKSRSENTLASIAREYALGYDELKIANPRVDPWLPGENTSVYLPTMTVLPDVGREGIVINLATMRLLHFNASALNDDSLTIESYPIGIGREGWATPEGNFHITEKVRDPNWYPPASVRREHAEMGDPLPKIVPPGPDNPLGRFKMRLSSPEYLIHGTNKPSGVGMRVSHGCIRLYPEHIADLFETAAPKTMVRIVNQPVLAGWHADNLFLEVHPLLAEDKRELAEIAAQEIEKALQRAPRSVSINQTLVAEIIHQQLGIPIPITTNISDTASFMVTARLTKNQVPVISQQETAAR